VPCISLRRAPKYTVNHPDYYNFHSCSRNQYAGHRSFLLIKLCHIALSTHRRKNLALRIASPAPGDESDPLFFAQGWNPSSSNPQAAQESIGTVYLYGHEGYLGESTLLGEYSNATGSPASQHIYLPTPQGSLPVVSILNGMGTRLARAELGQLPGWSHKHSGVSFWPDQAPTSDIAVAEWVVQAQEGCEVQLTAKHPKAGVVRAALRLGSAR
jgi:hypothetical protein